MEVTVKWGKYEYNFRKHILTRDGEFGEFVVKIIKFNLTLKNLGKWARKNLPEHTQSTKS